MTGNVLTLARRGTPPAPAPRTVIGALLARGSVSEDAVAAARPAARALRLPVEDVLVARGIVSQVEVSTTRAVVHDLGFSDLAGQPPDPSLADVIDPQTAIARRAVPVRLSYGRVVMAVADPTQMDALRNVTPLDIRLTFTVATPDQIRTTQIALYGDRLARFAEGRAPAVTSCRRWQPQVTTQRAVAVGLCLALLTLLDPGTVIIALCLLALFVFYANIALKITALAATLRARRAQRGAQAEPKPMHLPVVTLLVPLYREREIASTLVAHLGKIDYPPERLDVILLTEADDATTNRALQACDLPPWMRRVEVPHGSPRTKPRALNFGLNFAKGDVIGIYDAEDRPEPDQITKVVTRFAALPPQVACLQGRLDYYNAPHNPLARAFTIEYACWFRVLLPGVQRLGLFVPLGGTTVFFRRAALEEVGAWDAHNVTEDAELGLRLARGGYRTEIVETTTFEEANAAVVPWIRQRSRWQKGYLMTWAAAMRQPRALLRDLGLRRFIGLQVQVLFAVLGFLLAPLLWSLLVKPFGLAHPLDALFSPMQYGILAVTMIASLVLSMALSWAATSAPHLTRHRLWIPFVELYHGLGTLAAWRAATEMVMRPFFWSKTEHGRFGGTETPVTPPQSVPPLP